jgi:pantetheine-phosphate adenylyltransferase
MTLALCPGSFDPPTFGHIDVIERAAAHFSNVLVAVIANPSKKPLFALEDRVDMLEDSLSHVENVRVTSFDGLLVDFAREQGVAVLV